MQTSSNLLRLMAMPFFLGLSFLFSGSETALFSLTKEDLHHLAEKRGKLGSLICSLLEDRKDLLITILFGNMVANVFFFSISFGFLSSIGHPLVQTIGSILSLLAVIIFGEVVPKAVAVSMPCRFAPVIAVPIAIFKRATFPIRAVLGGVIDVFTGIAARPRRKEKHITADELKMLVGLSQKAGIIDPGERTMINEIVEFGDIRVKEVMTPRVDMTMFKLPGSSAEFRKLVRQTRHGKIPVYKGKIDNVVGVIHAEDVFLKPEEKLENLVRPVQFVPESKTIESLLRQFREQRSQMAMVVDEYGGFEGVVTLEDILEEIVGEIEDEFDAAKTPVQVTEDGAYLLSGNLSMREWAEIFGDDLMLPGVNTLGGFVTALLGHMPQEGEQIRYEDLFFTIRKIRRRRVAQVLLQLQPDRAEAAPKAEG